MEKYSNLILHSLLVGLIAAMVIIICGWLSVEAWLAFFAWANYFLHGCEFKKSLKMLLAFCVGIVVAFTAVQVIQHLNNHIDPKLQLYLTAAVIFVVATGLIFLECIQNWDEVVPATFLGTVLFFASGVTLETIVPKLLLPLCVGIIAGLITILSREQLNKWLNNSVRVSSG